MPVYAILKDAFSFDGTHEELQHKFSVANKEGDVFGSSNLAVFWEKERGIYSLSKCRSSKTGA